MIYPKNLTGPQFATSPLIELKFKGARITLPVPKIPINDHMVDKVTPIRDFSDFDTSYWQDDGLGNLIENIISQEWIFEDETNWDDIALCNFKVVLTEVSIDHQRSNLLLKKSDFKKYIIDGLSEVLLDEDEEVDHLYNPNWPKVHNEFNYEYISKPDLDWLQVQMCFVEGDLPGPLAYIPLDNRFALRVRFDMGTLHDDVRTNPYSDKLIHKLQFDLFAEYMQSIDLRYTENTLKIIREVNK
jgi:hypothetical protein